MGLLADDEALGFARTHNNEAFSLRVRRKRGGGVASGPQESRPSSTFPLCSPFFFLSRTFSLSSVTRRLARCTFVDLDCRVIVS